MSVDTIATDHARERRIARAIAIGVFAILVVRAAWIADVAYLTLRTVDHAALGFGLRWNIVERVQTFDHPLWVALLLGGRLLTGETYFSTIALSLAASLAATWLFFRTAASDWQLAWLALGTCLSPLVIGFSTSGLETPLLHLLIASMFVVSAEETPSARRVGWLAVLGGLVMLTRWNHVFLFAPVLAYVSRHSPWRHRVWLAVVTFGPLLMWLAWAFWYYGTLGSNGWVATQSMHRPWLELWQRGGAFIAETGRVDPLLVAMILCGALVGFNRGGVAGAWATGVLLVSAFVTITGGSEMAGRDLTASFLIALIVTAREMGSTRALVNSVACGAAVCLAAVGSIVTFRADASFGENVRATARTHDMRAEDFQATGLLKANRVHPFPIHAEADRARNAKEDGQIAMSEKPGFFGIASDAETYVFTESGVADPLLARLPRSVGTERRWEGSRRLPESYLAHLRDNTPLVESSLQHLDADVRAITRAPLDSPGRLGSIFRLPEATRTAIAESSYGLQRVVLDSTGGTAGLHEEISIREGGVVLTFSPKTVSRLSAFMSQLYDYDVDVLEGDREILSVRSPRVGWVNDSAAVRHVSLGRSILASAVRFRCLAGGGPCVLRDVRVDN